MTEFDVVIVGSGVGGACTAYRLARAGVSVLVLERGGYLPKEPENWSPEEVFLNQRYVARDEKWSLNGGKPEWPASYYNVGGATKMFGGVLARLRARDLEELSFEDGVSPAWPITYQDLEAYYTEAESLFRVHGRLGLDPTEPPHSAGYDFGPVDHEQTILNLFNGIRAKGHHPYSLPLAVERHAGGTCVRCATCDGFPCKLGAKNDVEQILVQQLLQRPNVTLKTHSKVERIVLDEAGRKVDHLIVSTQDGKIFVRGNVYVLSAGAINSAALLLRSADERAPRGIANSSGLVGRNYMAHNSSVVMAIGRKKTGVTFQKTMGLNDFYFGDADYPFPMGNAQLIGKVSGAVLASQTPLMPRSIGDAISARSVDWYVQTEDLPCADSGVRIANDGTLQLAKVPTNRRPHREIVKRVSQIMRDQGYPIVVSREFGIRTTSHQCGTARFGTDPAHDVLDPYCRTFDHPNLFVIDASFFPSSSGMNPSLTIAAQAFRAGDHILASEFGIR
ncbi:FAD-dependent oxidoreductase [Nitratireductor sp. ZSWI3]|uniref:FAD-dependent oxidoreductase n=1 Tax=Nitratireductor sp. ZSWI3 TaxID=2966359 RepID=UPI00214FCCAA|nr:GMC family oxidoreductase [Nitratireductor sp. ZSWI3]MCR4265830.1 GMC family oxidoreductase [Nitratireductor sp. ZSWI3]